MTLVIYFILPFCRPSLFSPLTHTHTHTYHTPHLRMYHNIQESLPLYKKLERKIETMNEYVQVCEEMRKAVSAADLSNGHDLHYVELYNTLLHIREDFSAKHRHWGPILTTNAE